MNTEKNTDNRIRSLITNLNDTVMLRSAEQLLRKKDEEEEHNKTSEETKKVEELGL